MGIIYVATNKINQKKYVGKTERSLEERKEQHRIVSNGKNPVQIISRAIKKYGFDNFEWEVVFQNEGVTGKLLGRIEKEFIKVLNTKAPHGYNMTSGGDGGNTFPAENIL
jgi:group I intron endonuclease